MAKTTVNKQQEKENKNSKLTAIKSSKEQTNDKLSDILKKGDPIEENEEILNNEEPENNDEDFDDILDFDNSKSPEENFLNFLRNNIFKDIDKATEDTKEILNEEINQKQEMYLKKILIDNENYLNNLNILTSFFKKHRNISISFNILIELMKQNLTNQHLENLAALERRYICNIEHYKEYINNKEVLEDNITNKLLKLREIKEDNEIE
jgi:hypothetical protein